MKKIYLLISLFALSFSSFAQFAGQEKPVWKCLFLVYPNVDVNSGGNKFTNGDGHSYSYISEAHCDSLWFKAQGFKWYLEESTHYRVEVQFDTVISFTPITQVRGTGYGDSQLIVPDADRTRLNYNSYDVVFVTANHRGGSWAGLANGRDGSGGPLWISLIDFLGDEIGWSAFAHEFTHSYMQVQSAINSRHPNPNYLWADNYGDFGYNSSNQIGNPWFQIHPFVAFYHDITEGTLTNYNNFTLTINGRTFYPGEKYIGTFPAAWRYGSHKTWDRWNLNNDFITHEYEDCSGRVLMWDQNIPMKEDVDFKTLRDSNDSIKVWGIADYIDTFYVAATTNPVIHTLHWETFGGSSIADQQLWCNTKLTQPSNPTKSGNTFKGWYKEPSCITEWIFYNDMSPDRDFTLYAKWLPASGGSFINLETASPAASGEGWSYANNIYTIHNNANVTISGSTTTKRVIVPPDTVATINLKNAEIDVSVTSGAVALQVTGATVNLTLSGKNLFKSSLRKAGIEQKITGTLTIDRSAEDVGVLYAIGNEYAAGIGGTGAITSSANNSCGTIIINGGIIYATNSKISGAGIGGGQKSQTGTVTINGGTIVALGANLGGAAIGAGNEGTIDAVTINGGTVYAKATDVAAITTQKNTGTSIGPNAIVFMTSESSLYNGTIDPDAIVIEEKKAANQSFLSISESAVSLNIPTTNFIIPENYEFSIPIGGYVYFKGEEFKNDGEILASTVNGVYNDANYAYGELVYEIETGIDYKPQLIETIDLKVYPNPVSDVLHIYSQIPIKDIIVSDLSGRTVIRNASIDAISTSIPASVLPKGIYLVTVETEKSKSVKKIIKN